MIEAEGHWLTQGRHLVTDTGKTFTDRHMKTLADTGKTLSDRHREDIQWQTQEDSQWQTREDTEKHGQEFSAYVILPFDSISQFCLCDAILIQCTTMLYCQPRATTASRSFAIGMNAVIKFVTPFTSALSDLCLRVAAGQCWSLPAGSHGGRDQRNDYSAA